jgi:pimeloyl-ACP methyl ester carboxylesterase
MTEAARWMRVEAHDGRYLEVLTGGAPSGLPLVFHSGTPSAATLRRKLDAESSARGLLLITYSRPGYAESTPDPGRDVAACAADVVAILDALGLGEFLTMGQSGGGPHALASVAQLPERCLAAASVAGAAPSDAEGLDWVAGMGRENVEEFDAAQHGEEALTQFLLREAEPLAQISPDSVADSLGGLAPPVDRSVITGELAESMADSLRRAVSHGIAGWRDDDLAFVRSWGFDVRSIQRPVAVWQGELDRMVPLDHGRWLAAHVPGAEAHIEPGHGHLSLGDAHLGHILDDLLRLAGREPAATPSTIT